MAIKMGKITIFLLFVLISGCKSSDAIQSGLSPVKASYDAVVALDGSGTHKSIQAAISSLTTISGKNQIIFIKNGVYVEKLSFENKNNFILKGESKENVLISISQSRDVWLCKESNNDWGVATVNIRNCNDLSFENLTLTNSYGLDNPNSTTIACPIDASGNRVVRTDGHQMVVRTAQGATRLKFINCVFKSYGGDTVSPWDSQNGMYYFKDCTIEGGVDMFCPRGWSYAENCTFINHNKSAAIWHDGSVDKNSKTVLKNCTFDGDLGFKLGRFHLDSQFYLINCNFSSNMADSDIYYVSGTPLKWDKRVFYSNCHRTGGDFSWHKDNLNTSEPSLNPQQIVPSWAFDGKWNPIQ